MFRVRFFIYSYGFSPTFVKKFFVILSMAAYGGGSMLAACTLPKILDRLPDRPVMLAGAGCLGLGLLAGAMSPTFLWLMPVWFILGCSASLN